VTRFVGGNITTKIGTVDCPICKGVLETVNTEAWLEDYQELVDLVNAATSDMDTTISNLSSSFVTKSTSATTYYVNYTTGNDNNNGLAAGTAFKTFAKAIGLIPTYLKHDYSIYIAGDMSSQYINLYGFIGQGILSVFWSIFTKISCQ